MTPTASPLNVSIARWTTRRVIAATWVGLAVVLGFLLLYRFRGVVVIAFTGIVVSMAIAPGVEWLHRHRLPRSASIIVIYLSLLAILTGFIVLIAPQIVTQISTLIPQLESDYRELKSNMANSPSPVLRQIGWQLPVQANLNPMASPGLGGDPLTAVGQALSTAGLVFGALFTLTAILLIGFYWTLEGEHALRALLLPLASEKRESAREILKEIETRVGGYVRGQGILAATISGATFCVYGLLGLPSVLAIALLAGLFELVPVFGPTLGAIPAVLVALTSDPSKVIWVIAASASIQFIENNVLAPRVMLKTVGVNPVVTLLSIVAFSALFGFTGLFLAIPIAAVIQIMFDRSVLRASGPELAAPVGRDRVSKLLYDTQEFILDVRKRVRHKEAGAAQPDNDDVEDTLEAIALDLNRVLVKTVPPENAT